MMKTTPTLTNIAAECGVSHVTVWRALKNHPNVNPETATRIRKYAHELGWKEKAHSHATDSGRRVPYRRKKASPIILPFNIESQPETGSLFWDYFAGVIDAAAESVYPLQVAGFHGRKAETDCIRSLVEKEGARGILDFGLQEETVDYLLSQKIPFVAHEVDVIHPNPKRSVRIYSDHIQGYVDAWRFFLDKGHRRVGFVQSEEAANHLHLNECLAAAQLLSYSKGIAIEITIPRRSAGGQEAVWNALQAQLGRWPNRRWPTALFCSNDQCAHLLISCLQAHGLHIPRDISIIGFDDSYAAQLSNPPLTTIAKPRKSIGLMMFHMMEQMITNGFHPQQTPSRAIPMHLVIRESVSTPLSNP